MALSSREIQFYGGGSAVGTLESPKAFSCEELLPDRIRVAASAASPTAAAFSPNNGFGPSIDITDDESHLFELLTHVREECDISSTLRVAGGWVRDKLLSTPEFQRRDQKGERLTSKFQKPSPQGSMGRQGSKILQEEDHQPVDIDIALDDMLGREFADHLNDYLQEHGQKTVSVGVVLKNPEKSKHLETATMKVGSFWVDFVNLRAEEYTQDSRIPDLMRIGSPSEDAFRRDLTINALFYNINTGQVEDWTGRGFHDLKRGVVATPLAPLTTLLDDPLRVLRSVRFAARLRFAMDDALVEAAMNERVRDALDEKVSRERIGCEVDLMLRSPDPVGAMRLLITLNLVDTVFPLQRCLPDHEVDSQAIFSKGLNLLSTAHDHLNDCKMNPPLWCEKKRCMSSATYGVDELTLAEDEEARRLLYYAAFLKPFMDSSHQLDLGTKKSRGHGKKAHRSVICSLLVDELKRPVRDVEAVVRIMKAADDITNLINSGCDLSATSVLLGGIRVIYQNGGNGEGSFSSYMNSKKINSEEEEDPLWEHAMEFRLLTSKMLQRIGSLWRASLILSLSEQLASLENDSDYYIKGDVVSADK
jgi:tRNA nucleotidyltransferase (CCA-adding enzyme)